MPIGREDAIRECIGTTGGLGSSRMEDEVEHGYVGGDVEDAQALLWTIIVWASVWKTGADRSMV